MRLVLENIGLLKHAEITLHPLCVIAGENDNGKSTVGKIVFCIIKAINRYKEDLQESKEFHINEILQEVYFTLRRHLPMQDGQVPDILRQLRSITIGPANLPEQLALIHEALEFLAKADERTESVRQDIMKSVEEIQKIADQPEDTRQSIENAFNKVFASEFDASMLLQSATSGSIRLYDGDLLLIHLEIDATIGARLKNDVEPIDIKDVTFIESPLILNHHDLLVRSQSMLDIDPKSGRSLGRPYTTLHSKDLFDKLKEPALPIDLFRTQDTTLLDAIQQLIAGEVLYDKSSRDFVFRKNNNLVSIKNTASGIKAFGLLQILLANEVLSKHTMLILDEPENHLHPKWQLQLAQMLVAMAKSGIYVLVSSHSPYMIEALKRYSDRAGMKDATGFFLAEKRTIEDRNRLGEIFNVLAEPFETFREMDAEDLRDE
ncbi:TPA: AAA family ATPase [Pseudomonas aeruginosa]